MIVISYAWRVIFIYWILGEALSYLNKHNEEVDCYNEAIKINPKNYYFW